jgi:hypothetical protein
MNGSSRNREDNKMNVSIKTISEASNMNPIAKINAIRLLTRSNKRVRVTFTKKDGSLRVMDCVPKNQYNDIIGKETTERGRAIVAAKTRMGMCVVSEIIDNGDGQVTMRPRTINLSTVKTVEIL